MMDGARQKDILKQAFRLTEVDHSTAAISTAINVGESLLGAWRGGQRPIPPEKAVQLADYLFKEDIDNRLWLVRSLSQAKETEKMTLLKDLDQGRRLRIGSTSRDGFGRNGLLDQFMVRFLRLSGINYRFVERGKVADLKTQLVQEDLDVGIGIFATLDRSLTIKFFTTPVRIGLNAVVLEETLRRTGLNVKNATPGEAGKERPSLRQILAPEFLDGFPDADLSIVPVVVRTDVGGIYATKTLGFTEANLEFAADHHYSSYAEKLVEEEQRYASEGLAKAPVAIVDDVSALYVLRSLDKKKAGARLVFPFSNLKAAGQEKKWMPEYLVSISVKRTNEDLVDYLRDALRLFLRTEVQMISSFYTQACVQLEDLATEFCISNRSWKGKNAGELADSLSGNKRKRAKAWTEYTFGLTQPQLDVHQDFELPWKPILETSKAAYAKKGGRSGSGSRRSGLAKGKLAKQVAAR